MDFLIGCNYWASNAGTEMWRNWEPDAVEEDLKVLSSHGVRVMRAFPNWRDFQPIVPMLGGGGYLVEVRLEGERPAENPFWLDETMLARFAEFCDLCVKYNIKLIVGLLTGWMSGRLFIPPFLYGKNLYSDPQALIFEQRFIKGFVQRFKDSPAIYAWDLGNECNCMWNKCDRYTAANWTGVIANAIRANDDKRPIVSGMHSLGVEDGNVTWTIKDQAEFCDILTTHPYPVFVEHAYKDNMLSFRTLMHATCETKYYADLGNRACLVEELGTLGPMFCSDKKAGDFMRLNLFSNWANGASGVMWWCANDFTKMTTAPYTWAMCEIELGMMDSERKPKPVLEETKRIAEVIEGFDFDLPKAEVDVVCILTQEQKQWGVGYMSYCMTKQAGLNAHFAFCKDKIPKSDCYIIPSVHGFNVMPRENYLEIKSRVKNGAILCVTNDGAKLADFREFFGVSVNDSGIYNDNGSVLIDKSVIEFERETMFDLDICGAKVLVNDNKGNAAITVFEYGQGKAYFVNFPLETMLLNKNDAFDGDYYKIYQMVFNDKIVDKAVSSDNKYIGVTLHTAKNGDIYCVLVNYSGEKQDTMLNIKRAYSVSDVYYGDVNCLEAAEACVFKLIKNT